MDWLVSTVSSLWHVDHCSSLEKNVCMNCFLHSHPYNYRGQQDHYTNPLTADSHLVRLSKPLYSANHSRHALPTEGFRDEGTHANISCIEI